MLPDGQSNTYKFVTHDDKLTLSTVQPDGEALLDNVVEHAGGNEEAAKALRLEPEASPGTIKKRIKTVTTTLWRNRHKCKSYGCTPFSLKAL